MSRQEVYSWASILSSAVFLIAYCLYVFGIPSLIGPVKNNLIEVIVILVIIDVTVQVALSIKEKSSKRTQKDERDEQFEAKGFKMAYYVFVVAVVILIGHLFVLQLIGPYSDPDYLQLMDALAVHYLVFVFFIGTTAKSLTQVILYRRDA